MKRIIFIILNIFLAASFCKAINNPPFSLDYYNNPSPGYIFLSPHLSREFYLVDNSSVPVFIEKINRFDEFINPRIQPDGLISFFSGTKYYFMNDNYEVLDSFVLEGNYEVDFHDIIRLPNGNTAMLGRDLRVMDLSSVIQGGQKEALVIGSLIQEFDINKNLVFQWNSFDHFKITDVVPDIDPLQHSFIACHVNSIYYDTDGNIIASCRALDEIIKIDRQNGDLIWILGGKSSKSNQFHFLNDTIDGFFGFSHQHSVMKLPNGNLLLFDNGDLKPKFYSRVVEYKLDEVNKTIEKVWEYNDSFKIATYSMGNVQRLPNGNTLIGWGLNSANLTATEVRPDGSKTLEISGYQNYAVYKDSYKMHSAFLYVDESGIYNFKSDTNITNIKINVKDLIGNGYVSVEKHYYQPHNPNFAEISPLEISENRWVISYNGIKNLDATVEFNFDECTLYNIF
ncbi:MAG: aryl-sulfate sulfotransferase, partial [Ignavibacteriae bacterium]|nr:aryl-sulfate sulfotransferase [Ignavibacteriota bacterium]